MDIVRAFLQNPLWRLRTSVATGCIEHCIILHAIPRRQDGLAQGEQILLSATDEVFNKLMGVQWMKWSYLLVWV